MKTRIGFVSNSSSSSFILTVNKDFDPENFIVQSNVSKNAEPIEVIKSLDDLSDYYKDRHGREIEKDNPLIELINDGKILAMVTFTNRVADEVNLCTVEDPNFEIIEYNYD